MKITINEQEYAYGDIQVFLWGRFVVGLKRDDYKTQKDKEVLYGAGRDPRGIQHGKRTYEGTITVSQSELIAMNRAAREKGYKDLLDCEIDIVVSYTPETTLPITMDRIIGASFSEFPKGMKQGDAGSEHAMPFVALNIEEDISAIK